MAAEPAQEPAPELWREDASDEATLRSFNVMDVGSNRSLTMASNQIRTKKVIRKKVKKVVNPSQGNSSVLDANSGDDQDLITRAAAYQRAVAGSLLMGDDPVQLESPREAATSKDISSRRPRKKNAPAKSDEMRSQSSLLVGEE